ncbi:helix-turn-helix domain-containing protein [Rossellomorea vietnamensis]|uniref:helix-turn-helix domain-containing protein n=1 Tax=Rossellomorea vietnamensis TaxID=218284 RepID=UPI001E52CC06|nr:helix-turn-helix transcriptional regulator [Rossellomorea vietnamensis]MCC5802253.1 helix-turn-helix transcriptional regulator [Rossellomorea vietnamensis]
MDRQVMRFIRTSNGLTAREFASKVNVSYSLISRIEGGDRRLTDRVKQKIMVAFGLTEEKLVSIKLLISEINN